jgi:lysyl-tRNA synthetase class 1
MSATARKGWSRLAAKGTTSIHNGKVKVGWKVDWALRWFCYDISYEMYGKDLIESAKLSGKIERLMGKQPPNGFFYELFLDEEGRKISKSVGKGLTIDTWVNYAPLESLLYYLFQNPSQAKRLFWGIVPKSVDDYLAGLRDYPNLKPEKQPDLAIWHIFDGLILEYLKRYDPPAERYTDILSELVKRGINYYRDFILPTKQYRVPTEAEGRILQALHDRLAQSDAAHEDELQSIPFDVARDFDLPPAELFKLFYEVALGQERGPRFGTFTRLIGKEKLLALLETAIVRNGAA